jgi:hypothetical protein
MRPLREIFHPTLLPRVSLPQGPRRHTRLRLQTKEVKGKQTNKIYIFFLHLKINKLVLYFLFTFKSKKLKHLVLFTFEVQQTKTFTFTFKV